MSLLLFSANSIYLLMYPMSMYCSEEDNSFSTACLSNNSSMMFLISGRSETLLWL